MRVVVVGRETRREKIDVGVLVFVSGCKNKLRPPFVLNDDAPSRFSP